MGFGSTTGAFVGTAGYASPEQVRGLAVDHRSDIFAFGTVLYEMLGGQRAFSGESPVEAMNAILKADPPPLPGVSPAIERIVRHPSGKPDYRWAKEIATSAES